MTLTASVQLWAGLGFTLIFVCFFFAVFFWQARWHAGQWVVIRVLSSVFAALAAVLFTGSALLQFTQTFSSGGQFAFQGAAGFALFFLVWWFFPPYPNSSPMPTTDGNINLLKGMSVRDAAMLIADKDLEHSRGIDFPGFSAAELDVKLQSDQIVNLKDGSAALLRLRDFVGDAVRPYRVLIKNDRYQMEPI